MNVVMYMFASDDWCDGVGLLCTCFGASVLKLQTLLLKTGFDSVRITMLNLTLLDRSHAVGVLFGKNFAILDWLDGSVVMVLVYLAVYSCLSLFMTLLNDLLIHNCGSDLLMDRGVVMTGLLPNSEALDQPNLPRQTWISSMGSR